MWLRSLWFLLKGFPSAFTLVMDLETNPSNVMNNFSYFWFPKCLNSLRELSAKWMRKNLQIRKSMFFGYHIWLLSLFSYIDSRFYLFQNGWVADIYTGKLDLDQDLEKIDRLVGNLSLMADQKNNLKGRCIWLFNL